MINIYILQSVWKWSHVAKLKTFLYDICYGILINNSILSITGVYMSILYTDI